MGPDLDGKGLGAGDGLCGSIGRAGATANIDKAEIASPDERIAMTRELTSGRGAEVVIEAASELPKFGQRGLEAMSRAETVKAVIIPGK
jgi:hypothetical protein